MSSRRHGLAANSVHVGLLIGFPVFFLLHSVVFETLCVATSISEAAEGGETEEVEGPVTEGGGITAEVLVIFRTLACPLISPPVCRNKE